MDTTQIKQMLNKLAFLKNYSAFILPLVLLVIVFPAVMGFGTILSKKLKDRIEKESLGKGTYIERLSGQDISSEQSIEEKKYMDAFEEDVSKISDIIKHTSQRELLSYKIFPEPMDTSVLIFKEFGDNYRNSVERLFEKYNAKQRPSDFEIEKAIEKSKSAAPTTRGRSAALRSSNRRRRSGLSLDRLGDIERKIVNYLCESTAKNASFYANISDIPGYDYWDDITLDGESSSNDKEHYEYVSINQSVGACWYWQVGFWIIEDIFKTLDSTNNECENVLNCPVKRLLGINFGAGGRGSSKTISSNPPVYITEDQPGMVPSLTNRESNPAQDIVHFEISVIVEAESVLSFIEELCSAKEHEFKGWFGQQPVKKYKHNQITVLNYKTLSVDKEAVEHQFYRYGDNAVVELKLICEYLFDRKGYGYTNQEGKEKIIMPDFVWNREDPDKEEDSY